MTTTTNITDTMIIGSVRRTVRVEEWTEKNQVKKQAKLQALRLVASDLSGTLYPNDEAKRQDFLTLCGF